jgi:hypothetical protein
MLRRVDSAPWSRFLAPLVVLGVLGVLGACSAPLEHSVGHVEVLAAGACDDALGGQLRLEGTATAVIALDQLCQGLVVRELPAGLYRLSWQGSADEDGVAGTAPAPLQIPPLLGVLAGRSTLVRLTLEVAPPAGSAAACNYAAEPAGPS